MLASGLTKQISLIRTLIEEDIKKDSKAVLKDHFLNLSKQTKYWAKPYWGSKGLFFYK